MIGIVIIGRNEGERLVRCLASVAGRGHDVVYVDSGSTDGSVEAARTVGAAVVELDISRPFTAARARNEGWRHLCEGGAPDFVQFVDGDCVLDEDWLGAANAALDADPRLAGVAGRRREVAPDASPYNRVCDMEWDAPLGEVRTLGGDALYRQAALAEVGGFDPAFICGEEPEMCFRLQAAGWRVARIGAEMTRHDADMTRFSQYWRRMLRTGWAYGEGAATYDRAEGGLNRTGRKRALRGGALFGLTLFFAALAVVAAALGSGLWVVPALGAFAGLGLIGVQIVRTAQSRTTRGDRPRHALLYGALITLGKPAQALGVLRYARAQRRGEAATIIEYKTPAARGAG